MFNKTINHNFTGCCPAPKDEDGGGIGLIGWLCAGFMLLLVAMTVRGYQTMPSEYAGAPVPIASAMPTSGPTGVPGWIIGIAVTSLVIFAAIVSLGYVIPAFQDMQKRKKTKVAYKKPAALIPERAESLKGSTLAQLVSRKEAINV